MELVNKLKEIIAQMEVDMIKATDSGNVSACRRARKACQEAKNKLNEIRALALSIAKKED
jgi:hypothetical protein